MFENLWFARWRSSTINQKWGTPSGTQDLKSEACARVLSVLRRNFSFYPSRFFGGSHSQIDNRSKQIETI